MQNESTVTLTTLMLTCLCNVMALARSAAMFAFRLHDWKCYSIDPAMEDNSTEVRLLCACTWTQC